MPKSLLNMPRKLSHFINNQWTPFQGESIDIQSPLNGQVIGTISKSSTFDIQSAIHAAEKANQEWKKTPIKERSRIFFNLRNILLEKKELISQCIHIESGKTLDEAKAGLLKGIEVIEFALSLQNIDLGGKKEVSRGVFCEYRREPLGITAGITPFNFPAMVPLWMIPIALVTGNAFIWKPSEKTPLTSYFIAESFKEAGLPAGLFNVLQGDAQTAKDLVNHPQIAALGFVGSTPVAQSIYKEGAATGKRILAMGGAKNHIFLLPDAPPEFTAQAIVDSFTGCAGQRCMAASVLLAIGETQKMIDSILKVASQKQAGKNLGAIISKESLDRLHKAIETASEHGAQIILDGRNPSVDSQFQGGFWLNPTILDHVSPQSEAAQKELFGPVLSIIRCKDIEEALEIENKNPFGNAASVFTQKGALAEFVAQNANAGMIGINIGVPVPREPFSFGGFYASRFGQGDITGMDGVRFWTQTKKITSKWGSQSPINWMS
ncbi:MAG: methylmalonate-semialdehyde dehydrogenase (CoA acylating) [Bdellovibrio sp.]|nr:MAG: methylmalonate-semialdehyde dehydrogenase (CoA acylating) [Bdellovibrio sp.]